MERSWNQPPISHEFQLMAKPIGPRCNLRCAYCFYREKERLYGPREKWRMTGAVLERYVAEYLDCLAHRPSVLFAWQGGEPTLMGLDFFRRAARLQDRHRRPHQTIENSFQTNGLLLDDEWCAFLRERRFLVGISLDGPPEVHDRWRRDPDGKPTSHRVLAAVERLERHGVEFNVLCSVHRANAARPREVYRFLRDLGVRFLQFIPIVVPVAGSPPTVTAYSVTPDAWGAFLCEVFDEWVRRNVGTVFVQSFDMALGAWMGMTPTLCVFAETCGRALIIEHNGDIYSCDHFVTPDHRLGNILERPLREIVDAERQVSFALAKRDGRPASCRTCRFDFACHGECPRNRLAPPPGEDLPLNYLCEGFKRFFATIAPCMQQMAQALRAGRAAAAIMDNHGRSPWLWPAPPRGA